MERTPAADEILLYNMDRQSNDVCLIMRQHDLLPICVAGDMQSLLGVTFEQLRQDVMLLADALEDGQKGVSIWRNTVRGTERSRSRPSFGQRTASGCRHRA